VDRQITQFSLVVRDYDEAIDFYTRRVGFDLIEDTPLAAGKRWVVVAPRASAARLLLAKASSPLQSQRVGDQAGGRVLLFLETDDFWRDYRDMKARGVEFLEEPRTETYGVVVVFKDLYGNKWDLLERAAH
jgi:catechol 2,3-dioxygenase-like lactoylglutathione lyase family enzyme